MVQYRPGLASVNSMFRMWENPMTHSCISDVCKTNLRQLLYCIIPLRYCSMSKLNGEFQQVNYLWWHPFILLWVHFIVKAIEIGRAAQSGGLVRRRPILTGRKNGFKIRPNRLSHQQGWSTSETTHIKSYWTWTIIHICKFNLVQKHKICQIMGLFTQNRQCYGEWKWGIMTDLWGDSVHRISQAMISWNMASIHVQNISNNNFIVYQSSPIWNVSKLPLKTSKTFGFDISPVQSALP